MAANKDPRNQNEWLEGKTPSEYLKQYASTLAKTVSLVPADRLDEAYTLVKGALRAGRKVYVGGNGGSAAIGDHLCCDWMKGTHIDGRPALKVHSLTANSSLFTALGNDFGYESTLSKQLEMLGEPGDVVILISSSGNSLNVVEAARTATKMNLSVIGMSGFKGGKLAELSTVSLHVPLSNYGMAEDSHQMLMHVLSQFLVRDREKAGF